MNRRRIAPGDEGFTLLETIVALGIVGAVMASLAGFFVRSEILQHQQADTQTAVQLAIDSMDYVSQLPGENLVLGRTQAAVQDEWQAPGVSTYLDPARTTLVWQDTTLPASSTVQGLPTAPETMQMSGDETPYQRWWYVGLCWQAKAGGDCTVVPSVLRSQYVAMYRVIVAITWPSPACTTGQCQYLATMLTESTLDDPTWQ
ncbi:prepilin-type N-terminal cleavage/methylation domain-containing protein [Actinoplanes sp. TFC3]|uniref:type IV pilus modification PilV family protein n=1 Tax=Actinoplanes sp. TFC3 TaxID=1710355 RepID=UPI000834CCE2|nr:type II secretion system protein [Actinoplanes sp. TFC3]